MLHINLHKPEKLLIYKLKIKNWYFYLLVKKGASCNLEPETLVFCRGFLFDRKKIQY